MKRFLLAVACAGLLFPAATWAKKSLTPADHVVVTLADGSTVQGYLYDHWYKGQYASTVPNTKFSIVEKMDDEKDDRDEYTVNDVSAIDFTSPEVKPAHYRACKVAYFDTEKLMQLLINYKYQIMARDSASAHATIYRCTVLVPATVGDNVLYEAEQYGVMMEGNPVVYPIVTGGKLDLEAMYHHLRGGKNGKFTRFMKNHFKKKKNRKAVERSPQAFLQVYEEYLSSLSK